MQFLSTTSLQQMQCKPAASVPVPPSPSMGAQVLQLLQALQAPTTTSQLSLLQSAGLNSNPSIPAPNLDFHVRHLSAAQLSAASTPTTLPSNPPAVPPLGSSLDLLCNNSTLPLGPSLASTLLAGKNFLAGQSNLAPLPNLATPFPGGMSDLLKGLNQTSKGLIPCTSISDEEASQADTNAGSRCSPDGEESKNGKKSSATYLTEDQAREIYSLRPQAKLNKGSSVNFSYSRSLSSKYGVDARTLRDIWNRRTWVKATYDLWTPQEVKQYKESFFEQYKTVPQDGEAEGPPLRVRGRPKGAKDSRPRKIHRQGRGTPSP